MIGTEEIKLLLFADDMTVHVANSVEHIPKSLTRINK